MGTAAIGGHDLRKAVVLFLCQDLLRQTLGQEVGRAAHVGCALKVFQVMARVMPL